MKGWGIAFCFLTACANARAQARVWQPDEGHTQIPIWPDAVPDAGPAPGPESETTRTDLVAGRSWLAATNVVRPTLTVYAPAKGKNAGAAIVVFPGGGFQVLAMDLEGTEACDWLTSRGITCVLLKYRVPSVPYDWHCQCYHDLYALPVPALQDAQRAIRLARSHAEAWHIQPNKVGVLGFSAGGYLVAQTSTNFGRRWYPRIDAVDDQDARPDFALAIYPGRLATNDDALNTNLPVSAEISPTFLVQAQDDHTDGVNQSLVYYAALRKAGVQAEMHLYPHGGHAFGLRPTRFPISRWPGLAETWLRTIGVLP